MSELFEGTRQRYLLEVPNPYTRMVAGQSYETTNHSGFSVDTAEHVRFYAKGAEISTSDFVAQATGQVWLQSLQSLVAFAAQDVMVASPTSTTIAAEGGVTIVSGFSPGGIATDPTPPRTEAGAAGTFPPGVESYNDTASILTGLWVIFDTLMAIVITAVSVKLTLRDGSLGWDDIEGGAANLVGAAVNLAGLSFMPWQADGFTGHKPHLPGINLFSQAGTLIGSALGGVTIIGLPGTLIASTFTTQFGLITSGLRGLGSCGMNALGPVGVTAIADVTVRGYKKIHVAARTGKLSLRGKDMIIGTEINPWVLAPQMPTTIVDLKAQASIEIASDLKISGAAKLNVKAKAGVNNTFLATNRVIFKSQTFKIETNTKGHTFDRPGGPSIVIDATGIKLAGPGKTCKGEMNTKILLDAGGATLEVVPGVSLAVDGTTFGVKP